MNSKYQYSKLNYNSTAHKQALDQDITDNPVDMCLFDDVDKSLVGGVLGYRYGPGNENCQLFMADRCSKKWDSVCDIASMNSTAIYPNNATIRGNSMASPLELTGGSTIGSQLIHNAAQRRFCVFNNCNIQQFPFDPTNQSSPTVTRINRSKYGCMPTCSVDPKTINSDKLMNKCLENPTTSLDTLVNICQTHEKSGVSLKGTKIGAFCDSLKNQTKKSLSNYYPNAY